MSKYRVFPGPYFPVFGLNTEIQGVNLGIQSQYRKMRTRKTPYLDTFHAVIIAWLFIQYVLSKKMLTENNINNYLMDMFLFIYLFTLFNVGLQNS